MLKHSFYILLVFVLHTVCFAKTFQILHTNDLHGFFEHSEYRRDMGGYAALKTSRRSIKA